MKADKRIKYNPIYLASITDLVPFQENEEIKSICWIKNFDEKKPFDDVDLEIAKKVVEIYRI